MVYERRNGKPPLIYHFLLVFWIKEGNRVKLSFTKMHGCGNNYIYFNCFDQTVPDPGELSVRLSEPHFGIGGDGIILISPSDKADAQMRIFNADGSEGKMCGNGIRCVGKYLYDNGMTGGRTTVKVDTLSGVKTLELAVKDGKMLSARVDMGAAILAPQDIPVDMEGDSVIGAPLVVDEKVYHITCVSMGNPHCVIFLTEDIDGLDLARIGPKFEHHALFPERVNTEFVNVLPDGSLKMRVWERGSGETWACGTGACAVGVAAVLMGYAAKDEDITVHLRGGDLTVRYTDETVFMTGAATTVFKGEIEI